MPPFVVIALWVYKSATPGKNILNLTVVDAKTGNKLTVKQSFKRYLSYFIYSFPFILGLIFSVSENQMDIRLAISLLILLVGIVFFVRDNKKQAWHDKIANTVVIRNKKQTNKVNFSDSNT
jgi:uncharacterized RDD family membrane protein YckC